MAYDMQLSNVLLYSLKSTGIEMQKKIADIKQTS